MIVPNNFKLFAFASNSNGNKIFCRLAYNKKTISKGYYDFDKEKYFITDYNKKNFPQNMGKNKIKEILNELLKTEYDWEL